MRGHRHTENPGLLKGVMTAYLVLLLHVLLIAGLALLVFFFSGLVNYVGWILLAGAVGLCISMVVFYRRMKAEQLNLREILRSPLFKGRNVEISFLGGFASLRIGSSSDAPAVGHDAAAPPHQLEDPDTLRQRELGALIRLLESDMISLEDYQKAKRNLLDS